MIARYQPKAQISKPRAVKPKLAPDRDVPPARRVRTLSKSTTDYDNAVQEAKQVLAKINEAEGGRMRLGELADKVEKRYSERKLKSFASDIGIAAGTLARCRSVWRAWHPTTAKGAPAPVLPKSYAVAQELQAHPQRVELVQKEPDMSKRKARQLMRDYKRSEKERNPNHRSDETKRWFDELVRLVGRVERVAAMGKAKATADPQTLDMLREVIEPDLLPEIRAAGELLIRLERRLQALTAGEP